MIIKDLELTHFGKRVLTLSMEEMKLENPQCIVLSEECCLGLKNNGEKHHIMTDIPDTNHGKAVAYMKEKCG